MIVAMLMALTVVAPLTEVANDQVRYREVSITVQLVADGNCGIRLDQSGELLRMGDEIVRVSVTPSNVPVCSQHSWARKRTGSESCGFLGWQRCPVYTSRDQQCAVLTECKYLLFRRDNRTPLCDRSLVGQIVGATTNFLPAVRPDVCEAACDQPGWTTLEQRQPIPTSAGTHLGTVTLTVKRSF